MSVTGRLGVPDSRWGNFALGSPGLVNLSLTISDTLTFTELMIGFKQIMVDTLTFNDAMTGVKIASASVSETLTFSDSIFHILEGSVTDTLTLSDTLTNLVWKTGSFSDTLLFTESILAQLVANRTIVDSLDLADVFTKTLNRLLSFSDTVNFADTLNGVAAKVFGDTVTFTDVMSTFVAKVFRDVLDLSDTFNVTTVNHRGWSDQVVLYDSLATSNVIRKTINDVLTLNDSIAGFIMRPLQTDTIPFSDLLSGYSTRPIIDAVTFDDGITLTKQTIVGASDTINLTDSTGANLVLKFALQDTISFFEEMRGIRQRFGTMSDTLTLSDLLLREVHHETVNDTLLFVESMTSIKISERSLNDALSMIETIPVKMLYNPGWSDYLLFAEGFDVKVKFSGQAPASVLGAPFVLTPPPTLPTLPPGAPPLTDSYFPSPVWVGVTAVLPQVAMIGKTRSIVLPSPEFNDFGAGQGKIAVQRSMTGRFRVYAKRTTREKLNWRFVIPKYKADEFRDFILAEIDTELNVVDWDGSRWNLKILSDSVDFTESRRWSPCGNAVEVTVELVGNRYA